MPVSGFVPEKRADQRFPSVVVDSVPGPECGDVGRLGERVGGCLAAVASGKPVVALLGVEDVGQVVDVVLPAAVRANGWAEPDQVAWHSVTSAGCQVTAKMNAPRREAQRQQTVRRT